jgi:hypothetical protein
MRRRTRKLDIVSLLGLCLLVLTPLGARGLIAFRAASQRMHVHG